MAETVLLVEDDPGLRRLAARLLTKLGYTVVAAAGADSAVARYRDSVDRIDLLITDVFMPDVGGPELARRLQAMSPSLKVLYVSGSNEALESGALAPDANFLLKPFTLGAFGKKIREILDR